MLDGGIPPELDSIVEQAGLPGRLANPAASSVSIVRLHSTRAGFFQTTLYKPGRVSLTTG